MRVYKLGDHGGLAEIIKSGQAPSFNGAMTGQKEKANRECNPDGDMDLTYTNEPVKTKKIVRAALPRPENFEARLVIPEGYKAAFKKCPTDFVPVEVDGKFILQRKLVEPVIDEPEEPFSEEDNGVLNYKTTDKKVTLFDLQQNAMIDAREKAGRRANV